MTAPRSILIIGASRGLGLGLAKAFVARGWTVTATVRSAAQQAPCKSSACRSSHWK